MSVIVNIFCSIINVNIYIKEWNKHASIINVNNCYLDGMDTYDDIAVSDSNICMAFSNQKCSTYIGPIFQFSKPGEIICPATLLEGINANSARKPVFVEWIFCDLER